jgi:hypothetical protein
MRISVRRFMAGMVLLGTSVAASIAVWKNVVFGGGYLSELHFGAAAALFFSVSATGAAGCSLLMTRKPIAFFVGTLALAAIGAFVQLANYCGLFYRT